MSIDEWDDDYCDVMARKYGLTNMSNFEVLGIGAAVMNWIVAVERMGHASPASTLDYTVGIDDLSGMIVRDFVAWSSGRLKTVPDNDPETRMKALTAAANWEHEVVEKCLGIRGSKAKSA